MSNENIFAIASIILQESLNQRFHYQTRARSRSFTTDCACAAVQCDNKNISSRNLTMVVYLSFMVMTIKIVLPLYNTTIFVKI